ncbi:DNA adenine methylase [Bacillus sp. Bva_UNVM-123]|uniref:DNA adenine methylase n=1 Tax=Bacillus sp. Bva_UNVM-123 TaxID=2829798 RepID=UPI00391F5167
MLQTKDIIEQFDISRQSLYTWIKTGQIEEPKRNWKGWLLWTEENIKEIAALIESKQENKKISTTKTLSIQNRRYLGGKHKLLPFIEKVIQDECGDWNSLIDIFAGTGVVGYHFNSSSKSIIVNDLLYSNYLAYLTWFGQENVRKRKITQLINHFNENLSIHENYVSSTFGNTFFTMENALKIGYAREKIDELQSELNEREKAILLTSLMYAMDKVANTCGHYDAYREKLDTTQTIKFLVPDIPTINTNKNNLIFNENANELIKKISGDILYIDPPYNSRQYGDTYHVLENIAEWKKPVVTGKAKKMIDRAHLKSDYCTIQAPSAFDELIVHADVKYIIVSFNNMAEKGNGRSNAKISDEDIISSLEKRGEVKVFSQNFKHFTTGKRSIDDHQERLFFCKVNTAPILGGSFSWA